MRVIANDKNKQVIVAEIHYDELANLMGFYSKYSDGFKADAGEFINVSKLYNHSDELSRLKGEMEKMREFLVKCSILSTELYLVQKDGSKS